MKKGEQYGMFDHPSNGRHFVLYKLRDEPERQTMLMTLEQCVDFNEFMDAIGYNWEWRMIKKADADK